MLRPSTALGIARELCSQWRRPVGALLGRLVSAGDDGARVVGPRQLGIERGNVQGAREIDSGARQEADQSQREWQPRARALLGRVSPVPDERLDGRARVDASDSPEKRSGLLSLLMRDDQVCSAPPELERDM